jgi:hypothetical protein
VLLGDGQDMAMDRDTTASAHPAFVSMIAQLIPDEAKILKSIDRDVYAYFDLPGGLQTVLGAGIGINESKVDFYISNLVRLGIIQLHTGGAGERSDAPAELSQLVSSRFPVPDVGVHTALQFLLFMRVTPLGQQFLDACVRPRTRSGGSATPLGYAPRRNGEGCAVPIHPVRTATGPRTRRGRRSAGRLLVEQLLHPTQHAPQSFRIGAREAASPARPPARRPLGPHLWPVAALPRSAVSPRCSVTLGAADHHVLSCDRSSRGTSIATVVGTSEPRYPHDHGRDHPSTRCH